MAMLDGIKPFSFTPSFFEKLNIWHICLTFIKGNTMNKTLLLAGIATSLLAANANAVELNPYVSAKAAFVKMENDANVNSDYSFGGTTHHQNALANEKHKDDVWGLRFAAGAATPVKYGQVRGEFELGWNDDAKDSNNFAFKIRDTYNHKFATELSVYSAMLNVYYDIDTGTKFTPYVGGGIGMAYLKNKTKVTGSTTAGALNLGSSESENNFAWNIGAGVSYALNDKVSIDAGYRYSDYGNVKESVSQKVPGLGAPLNVDGKYDVTSHEFLIGARYAF